MAENQDLRFTPRAGPQQPNERATQQSEQLNHRPRASPDSLQVRQIRVSDKDKYYGTSHVLSKDEAKFVFEKGCEQLIIGSGQIGNVHLSPEAEAYFAKKGCKVLLQPTPEAIRVFNKSQAKKIGLFHVTC